MAETIFFNADYIVVEYMDIIAAPWFSLLLQIHKNDKLRGILKIEEIENLEPAALMEWYINRKHQNFFVDLRRDNSIPEEKLDQILEDQMTYNPRLYTSAICLPMMASIEEMKRRKMAKDVIIYHPYKNTHASTHIKMKTNRGFRIESDFTKILEKTGSNSTYFLSNSKLIMEMKEKNCLRHSSISLPIEYRYNKKNMRDFSLDFDALVKEHPFKLSFFHACTEGD